MTPISGRILASHSNAMQIENWVMKDKQLKANRKVSLTFSALLLTLEGIRFVCLIFNAPFSKIIHEERSTDKIITAKTSFSFDQQLLSAS